MLICCPQFIINQANFIFRWKYLNIVIPAASFPYPHISIASLGRKGNGELPLNLEIIVSVSGRPHLLPVWFDLLIYRAFLLFSTFPHFLFCSAFQILSLAAYIDWRQTQANYHSSVSQICLAPRVSPALMHIYIWIFVFAFAFAFMYVCLSYSEFMPLFSSVTLLSKETLCFSC